MRSLRLPYCHLAWRLQADREGRRHHIVFLQTVTEDTAVAAHYDNTVLRSGREIVARSHCHEKISALGTQGDFPGERDRRRNIVVSIGLVAGYRAVPVDHDDLEEHSHY